MYKLSWFHPFYQISYNIINKFEIYITMKDLKARLILTRHSIMNITKVLIYASVTIVALGFWPR